MIPILKMLGLSESGPRPQIAGLAGLNSMQPSIAGLSGIGSPSARAEQAAMPFEDRTWSTFTPAAGAQSRGINDMPWVFSETQNIPKDPAALLRLFFQQPDQRQFSGGPGVPALQSGSNGGWQSEGTGNPALNQFPAGSTPIAPSWAEGAQRQPPMIYWTGPGEGFVIENGAMRDATWEEMEFERQRKMMQAMGWGGGGLGGSDVGTAGDVPGGGGWSGGASGNGGGMGGWGGGWGGGDGKDSGNGDTNGAGHESGHDAGNGGTGTGGLY